MKTNKLIAAAITCFAIAAQLNAQAPNRVTNGSFENTPKKVHNRGEYWRADSITSSNNTTVDLYSRNACGKDYDVPTNYMGTQESKEGNNYAGIIAYYADDAGFLKTKPGYRKYSEYIQMPLTEPLVAGQAYVVTFSASLAEKSAYAVSGLGVYFTNSKLDVNNNAFLNVTPHIVTTEIVTNTEWTTFTGVYVATGGERYMTLGCFDKYMAVQKVVPEGQNNSRKAYYFIDDIGMTPQTKPSDDFTMVLSGSCYQLKNLNFETDKAVIMAGSFDELHSLANFLKTYPYLVVYVDGHTDKTGTDAHNDKLSEERAMAIKNYLVENGIAGERLKVRGYGESMPIDKANENSMTNRRVEITICATSAYGRAEN